MRVLLDECVPRRLRRELPGHEVFTVTGRGWSGIKNGKLLALADTEFDLFLTVDQNLKYQQNLTTFRLAVILLVARNNRLQTLLPLMPEVREALDKISAGEFHPRRRRLTTACTRPPTRRLSCNSTLRGGG